MKNYALIAMLAVFLAAPQGEARAESEGRAADGSEVVLKRLFPKTKSVELEAGFGFLLNPTFVDTGLATAGLRYHWSEAWGLGLRFGMGISTDRSERRCVESFYNDPYIEGSAVCSAEDGGQSLKESERINIGPAYVPIRVLEGLVMAYGDYTLAYGKQIILHGIVSHFDLRVRFGAGAILSSYYAERTSVRGDASRPARGDPIGGEGVVKAGVTENETDEDGLLYGDEGRPQALKQTSPAAFLAVAEELHFARRFFVAGELSAYVMSSEGRGIEALFLAHVGLGMRL